MCPLTTPWLTSILYYGISSPLTVLYELSLFCCCFFHVFLRRSRVPFCAKAIRVLAETAGTRSLTLPPKHILGEDFSTSPAMGYPFPRAITSVVELSLRRPEGLRHQDNAESRPRAGQDAMTKKKVDIQD